MRFTPLVGRKAWYGPRSGGWGWDPVSWEGWVALPGWSMGGLFVASRFEGAVASAVVAGSILGLVATIVLKGTSPGGSAAADRFHEMRGYAERTPEMIEADRLRRRLTPDEPSVTDAAARLRDVRARRRRR